MTARPAGYSGTPLVSKLGIKPGMLVRFVNPPAGYPRTLGKLPQGVIATNRPARTKVDFVQIFTASRSELERSLPWIIRGLKVEGMLWISWPKKASKVPTDMTEDVIREVVLPQGLVDVKVCAVDETWSGLKIVRRVENR